MTTLFLLAAVALPAAIAPLVVLRSPLRPLALSAAPWAAVPALLLALAPIPHPPAELSWLLLGGQLGLDGVGRIFLLFSALLWAVSGRYARVYVAGLRARRRFFFFFLLTMSGNLGLPLAQDVGSFYLFFALMTFAGYGLVVHAGSSAAKRAGRIYLIMAVGGEAVLVAGLLLAVHAAGTLELAAIPAGIAASPAVGAIVGCLLIGFGIKAGAVPLHVWLPLAHPVAPTPASAVLSGSMIKAGVLGWLRFLPLGETALPGWGGILVALGALAAFFGVVIGLMQRDPKTVLAYSSISQIGLMNIGVGIALAAPAAVESAFAAVLAYAVHHGMAKGALFLGVGIAAARTASSTQRRLVLLGLLLPALAVAGAPLSSGSVAKGQLKTLLPLVPPSWPAWLDGLLPLSAIATTLLMAHFLMLAARQGEADRTHRLVPGLWQPWVVLLAGVAFALWLLPRWYPVGPVGGPEIPGLATLRVDILPVAAGVLLFWMAVEWSRRSSSPLPFGRIAPGDLLNPIERAVHSVPRSRFTAEHGVQDPIGLIATKLYRWHLHSGRQDAAVRVEVALTRWVAAIFLVLLIVASLLLTLARGAG
jgi:formate hydrogenlyase subunit 3/multisubunit Na+/H+ antiporter MnhD subunit